jgi:uncharacterized protein
MRASLNIAAAAFVIACSGAPTAQSAATGPSFDCAKAAYADEKAICGDRRLAELDRANAAGLAQYMRQENVDQSFRKDAQETAGEFLLDRRGCGDNRLCIVDAQMEELDYIANQTKIARNPGYTFEIDPPPPAWVAGYRMQFIDQLARPLGSGVPTEVGDCAQAKITRISGRFTDRLIPPNSATGNDGGTSVGFSNDFGQVSYSYEPPIAASHIGDDVIICLHSLPRNCPPDDDRGKKYSTTNLRTKQWWTLSDVQHMCGGA